ncbi:MAG: hypothetical protein Q9174_000993 [Haloplaca sp. 1 TL-2023]
MIEDELQSLCVTTMATFTETQSACEGDDSRGSSHASACAREPSKSPIALPREPTTFPFLSLPREIRDMIYEKLWVRPGVKRSLYTTYYMGGGRPVYLGPGNEPDDDIASNTELLFVNKQIYAEVNQLLYEANTWVIDLKPPTVDFVEMGPESESIQLDKWTRGHLNQGIFQLSGYPGSHCLHRLASLVLDLELDGLCGDECYGSYFSYMAPFMLRILRTLADDPASGRPGRRKKLVIQVRRANDPFDEGKMREFLFPSQLDPGRSWKNRETPTPEHMETVSEILDLVRAISSVREISIISIMTNLHRPCGQPPGVSEQQVSLEGFGTL